MTTKQPEERKLIASISMTPKLIDQVDYIRGKESRSSFVCRIVEKYIEDILVIEENESSGVAVIDTNYSHACNCCTKNRFLLHW